MRASNLPTILKQAADPYLSLAINVQRGESHYSYQDFFCNIFFRFVSTGNQLSNFPDRSLLQHTFSAAQTTRAREDT